MKKEYAPLFFKTHVVVRVGWGPNEVAVFELGDISVGTLTSRIRKLVPDGSTPIFLEIVMWNQAEIERRQSEAGSL